MAENTPSKRKRSKDGSVFGQLTEAVTTLSSGKVNGKSAKLNEFEISALKTYKAALERDKKARRVILCEEILLAELEHNLRQRGGVLVVPKDMTCEEWVARGGRRAEDRAIDESAA